MSDEGQNYFQLHGERLADNGYSVIPIKPGTKKPGQWTGTKWVDMSGWSKPANEYDIGVWKNWPSAGVGVLCGEVVAVDIDVLDQDVVYRVLAIIDAVLGQSHVIRVGKKPKMLVLYRTDKPFKKIKMGPLEVLADGQQFVAYATHPDTGLPYTWPADSILDVPVHHLPTVTEEQVREAIRQAYDMIPAEMKPAKLLTSSEAYTPPVTSELKGTMEALVSAMDYIDNPSLSWDDWNRVGMALYAASEGSAFSLFNDFSAKSNKYDPKDTQSRWDSYRRSPPRSIGAGTVYKLAMDNGWSPPYDIALNDYKRIDNFDFGDLLSQAAVEPPPPATEDIEKRISISEEKKASFPHQWFDTPSLVGEITRYMLSTSLHPHPTFSLMNTICLLGAVFGRRYRAKTQDTRCNLFAVAIAKTGSGKDHSRACAKMLLTNAGLGQLISGDSFTSGIAVINMLSEYPSRISHMDELGKYLQNVEGKNSSNHQKDFLKRLLELYSSSSSVYHGQEYANSKDNPRTDIFYPNFNLFGSTTPSTLAKALRQSMQDDGTLSRMLLVPPFEDYPAFQKVRASKEPPSPLVARLKSSWEVKPKGGNLTGEQHISTSEVSLIDVVWNDEVDSMIWSIKDLELELKRSDRTIWARLTENTIKVAMIEAIALDPVAPVINESILAMSFELVQWCMSYAESLMADSVSENEHEASLKKILKLIKDGGKAGVNKTIITRSTLSLKIKDRDDMLATLIESGQVTEAVYKPAGKGRPSKVYKAA